MGGGSLQMGLSASMLVTSLSRRSRARAGGGQRRMAGWKDSGSSLQRGHVGSGSSSNHEGWAAR